MRFELGDDVLGVVAQIIDSRRLAAPDLVAVAELDHHHVRGLEHEARDPERRRQRVRLDAVGEPERPHQKFELNPTRW